MKILHTEGFTPQDKLKFRSVIYSNIVRNMKILSDAIEKLNIPLAVEVSAVLIFAIQGNEELHHIQSNTKRADSFITVLLLR